jgi:Flp pilus assembly CpaE family ATPase
VALDLGLDDAGSLVIACRHAEHGTMDRDLLTSCATPVRPGLAALTGVGQAERWPDLRPGALDKVWEACRSAYDVTVVDVGFCLEGDDDAMLGRRRNAAALSAVGASDRFIAVATGSGAGAARLVWAWPALPTRPDLIVRNRVPRRDTLGRQWRDAAAACGIDSLPIDLPDDPAALVSAWRRGRTVVEASPRSRLRRSFAALAEHATMDTGR